MPPSSIIDWFNLYQVSEKRSSVSPMTEDDAREIIFESFVDDSLDALQLIMFLEEKLDCEIEIDDLKNKTIAEIATFLSSRTE